MGFVTPPTTFSESPAATSAPSLPPASSSASPYFPPVVHRAAPVRCAVSCPLDVIAFGRRPISPRRGSGVSRRRPLMRAAVRPCIARRWSFAEHSSIDILPGIAPWGHRSYPVWPRLSVLLRFTATMTMMSLVKTFGLASAICGAIGTLLLLMASSAFETPNQWGTESLRRSVEARNRRRQVLRVSGLGFLMASFVLAGVSVVLS